MNTRLVFLLSVEHLCIFQKVKKQLEYYVYVFRDLDLANTRPPCYGGLRWHCTCFLLSKVLIVSFFFLKKKLPIFLSSKELILARHKIGSLCLS